MSLQIIETDNSEQWDNIVKSFKDYTVHYLSGYAKAFQLHGDGEPLLFFFDNGRTRAVNVVMKRDIAQSKQLTGKIEEGIYFDFVTPYGYGGFIIEGDDCQSVMECYVKWCEENSIVCEFVRFNLFSDTINQYGGTVEAITKNIVCDLKRDYDIIWMDFAHKVRKNYNIAVRSGMTLQVYDGTRDMVDFLDIYYSTMNRNDAQSSFYFSERFFNTLNLMNKNAIYFDAIIDGNTVSTELVLYDNNSAYSFLGGSNRSYYKVRPNDFIKVEIIKWAQNIGLSYYVLGGGYGSEDGIYNYKKAFSPNGIYEFRVGKWIFDIKSYNMLINMRKASPEFQITSNYFPVYRA